MRPRGGREGGEAAAIWKRYVHDKVALWMADDLGRQFQDKWLAKQMDLASAGPVPQGQPTHHTTVVVKGGGKQGGQWGGNKAGHNFSKTKTVNNNVWCCFLMVAGLWFGGVWGVGFLPPQPPSFVLG